MANEMVRVLQPTLDTDAYTAGDACGALLTFDFGKKGSRTMVLKRAEILDDAAAPDSAGLELHLFANSAFAVADDAAFTLTQAEYLSGDYFGYVSFSSYEATPAGDNAAAVLSIRNNLDRLVALTGGQLFGQLVCTGTPTFAASQLLVAVHLGDYS